MVGSHQFGVNLGESLKDTEISILVGAGEYQGDGAGGIQMDADSDAL